MLNRTNFYNWCNATFSGLSISECTAVCFDLKNSECARCDEKFNWFINELHNWYFVQYAELIPTEYHKVYQSFDNLSHNDREWVKEIANRIRTKYFNK